MHRQIALTDRSSIGEVRRAAMMVAESLGFSEERRSDVGIVATEAATNVILHAQAGEMLLCPGKADGAWLDLLAMDCGPGIVDVPAASCDGYSSLGTAGEGLGAIRRQSDESDLFSVPGRGTVQWSRISMDPEPTAAQSYGVVNVPMRGETACGDSFAVEARPGATVYMVVDGLGHGPQAAEAAEEAVLAVKRHALLPLQEILTRTHEALRKTRGAAMAVAVVHEEQKVVTFAGVGNIGAMIHGGGQARSLVSQNGTLGVVMPRQIQQYQYPYEAGSLLVMFSDGLNTRVSLSSYRGLANRHPELVAGVLYRDFCRKRDDATVLVARLAGQGIG